MSIRKYGALWDENMTPVEIEMDCIRAGGIWHINGVQCGKGLKHHYRELDRLLWPDDYNHRWSELIRDSLAENKAVVVMGPASSQKTHQAAKELLMDYMIWPDEFMGIVSTTSEQGLELRIWGRIKGLFNRARALWGKIMPGNVVDYMMTITTDNVGSKGEFARVLTKGIICVSLKGGNRESGIDNFIGIKQERLTLVGDEAQTLGWAFARTCSNLNANPGFKVRFLGNPKDPADTLGRVGEPKGGWDSHPEPEQTTTWRSTFLSALVINLVGTDSPNLEFPEDQPERYKGLLGRRFIQETGETFGFDSAEFYQMCKGVMKPGLLERRVITRDIVNANNAKSSNVVWSMDVRQKIYAVDAAYSGVGGDRCVKGWCEIGTLQDGTDIIWVGRPSVLKIRIDPSLSPEMQIAQAVKNEMEANSIPVENGFYDSTGRGTLGSAFAAVFGHKTPIPIEFGGRPTKRPVRHDLYVEEVVNGVPMKRHKRCDEHYFNFVTELWFSARYVIECGQMRNLPDDVLQEGCLREYDTVMANKLKVEPKDDPKCLERMGRSPDLFDWLVTCIEGARRRGFKIQKLGAVDAATGERRAGPLPKWLEDKIKAARDIRQRQTLSHSR